MTTNDYTRPEPDTSDISFSDMGLHTESAIQDYLKRTSENTK